MEGILITGGAKRLGKALVKQAIKLGKTAHLHFNQSEGDAHALAKDFLDQGIKVYLHQADLSEVDNCKALIEACVQQGPLTSLINNACHFSHDQALDFSAESFDKHMAINARAPLLLTKYFAQAANDSFDYSVINLTDARLFGLNTDYYSYTASKFALEGMTKAAALSYAPKVRVNAIAPHMILSNEAQTSKDISSYNKLNPLQCDPLLEDVVMAMTYLLKAKSVTGSTMIIDGGAHLNPTIRDPACE
ncbi:MAG TPA: SDR family oxidoreductase [Gammaproteobacteria bacterium]|nr:SDR family oxidoreductase [Gammaproteobacteria bacterium]